jgi:hypothetical protein
MTRSTETTTISTTAAETKPQEGKHKMSDTDYKPYYNQQVSMIIDGRGWDTSGYTADNSVSLAMTATPTEETELMLTLEEITILNRQPLHGKYAAGSIQKQYIIGIFQETILSNDIAHVDDNNLNH